MSKEIYTPMPEANTDRIRTMLSLPFSMEENIGLDVKKVIRLAQIAGFSHIKIENDNSGLTSESTPLIVGWDKNGGAFAGMTKQSKVPTFSDEYKESDSVYKCSRWANLRIKINNDEIKARLLRSGQKVNSPKPWAIEINSAIKKSILSSGTKHLLETNEWDKVAFGLIYGLLAWSVATDLTKHRIQTEEILPSILFRLLTDTIIWNAYRPIVDGIEKPGAGSRMTFLATGPEIDRALVLQLSAHGSPLVNELDTKPIS